MKPVFISPRAALDLREIGDWIAQDNPRRALTFVAELRDHALRIGHAPEAPPRRDDLADGLRMAVHRPYLIFFRIEADAVRIERVLHGARDLRGLFGDRDAQG
ncbi:MAG TPA: type II toxin-antitoxin system RelE/ParE family toxin [Caulobacteraceae bacterium]